ncbi:FAD/NAD(P)-binding protein [Xenorhabdus bovienii]|uniref:FAD/NAD(P)-binding protein n=1 Tax=Xenorhabdus bovienii TaxID=40576 RepID=UPI002157CEAE|nr:FAD/NAD(P)-binding protein [Xenorhabdus bovienii]
MRSIAIVGGGLGGISAFSQLVNKKIIANYTVYEPASIAYGSSLKSFSCEHLCNTSVLMNSLHKDKPDDFLRYLKQQGYAASGESFVPRFLLLQYARETFTNSVITARRAGSVVEVIKKKITSFITNPNHRCILFDEDCNEYFHHFAFFSPGPILNKDKYHDISCDSNLVASSNPEQLDNFAINKKNIAIMGTKLSAIDSSLLLCRKGIKVTLYSPSGELPAVRKALVYHPEIDDEFLKTSDLFSKRNFIKKINENTQRIKTEQQKQTRNSLELLSRDIRKVKQGKADWQHSIASIIDYANTHLRKVPEPIKNSVISRTKYLVSRYISSFPLENALKVHHLIESSMLKIKQGELKDFSLQNDSVKNNKSQERYDGLIIATGVNNLTICKINNKYIISQSTSGVTEKINSEDLHKIKNSGVWLSGSLLHEFYPIVNYLKFCVDQAFFFSKSLEELTNENRNN